MGRLLTVIVVALAVAPGSSTASQVSRLKHKLAAMTVQRDQWKRLAGERGMEAKRLNDALGSLTWQLADMTGQRDKALVENIQLRGELPDRVAAVAKTGNISDLVRLVLSPAHANWACGGSVFTSETFVSYDFDRRASDGYCY